MLETPVSRYCRVDDVYRYVVDNSIIVHVYSLWREVTRSRIP